MLQHAPLVPALAAPLACRGLGTVTAICAVQNDKVWIHLSNAVSVNKLISAVPTVGGILDDFLSGNFAAASLSMDVFASPAGGGVRLRAGAGAGFKIPSAVRGRAGQPPTDSTAQANRPVSGLATPRHQRPSAWTADLRTRLHPAVPVPLLRRRSPTSSSSPASAPPLALWWACT